MKQIYITYCWEDETIADLLDCFFQQVGIKLIRDKRDLKYGTSIEKFAKKMRRGSYNICLISDKYLNSVNCMYEIVQLLKDDNFATKKFCPIIVDTTNQVDLSPDGIEKYASFWETKINSTNIIIDKITDNVHKLEQIELLKKLKSIYDHIREFLFLLKDTKYVTVSEIKNNGISVLDKNIFCKIGINPKFNLEELYNISQLTNIEDAENKLSEYANNHLIKNNEYYLYTKAVVYEKNGYYDLALYNYKLAYGVQEKFILAYEAIIMMYLKGAIRIDNELSAITETLEGIDKNNNRVITAKGLLAMKSRDYISAIELFDSLINQDILNKECIYNNLANAHERQYDFDNDKQHLFKAEEFYKKAVGINPQYYQAFNNLSLLYLIKFKETQKAEEVIEECLRIFPNYHMALNTYGLIYEEYKDFDNALQCYFQSYENSKSYSPPINQIGRILDFEYENSLCKNYYELAYQINPNSFVNCFNLGNYYRKYTENIEEANNYLSTALKQFPTHILCNMSMGLLKYKIKDYIAAREYFSYAFALNLEYAEACFCLALCEYKIDSSSNRAVLLLEKFLKANENECNNKLLTLLKTFDKINDSEIENILKKEIEYNYVNVPEQIYKSLELNAKINIHEAYQYIANNFYELNP